MSRRGATFQVHLDSFRVPKVQVVATSCGIRDLFHIYSVNCNSLRHSSGGPRNARNRRRAVSFLCSHCFFLQFFSQLLPLHLLPFLVTSRKGSWYPEFGQHVRPLSWASYGDFIFKEGLVVKVGYPRHKRTLHWPSERCECASLVG